MARNLYEVLEQVNSKNSPDADMKAELRKHQDDYALKQIFKMVYDMDFVGFDLPEGAPPYKTDPLEPYGYANTSLTSQIRKLYIFLNDFTVITRKRKETLFIELLEGLHFREAELLLAVKDKDISSLFSGINECLIREVFPDWLNPITNTGYIDAAIIHGFGWSGDPDTLVYSRYTIEEIRKAGRRNTIVFFDYEHAKLAGINELSYDYVEEIDDINNIEVILTKKVFGVERVIRTWVPISNIAMSKKAAELRFVDIERAKELGIDHYETNAYQERLQTPGAKITQEEKVDSVVVKNGGIPDIVRPLRKKAPVKKPTTKPKVATK